MIKIGTFIRNVKEFPVLNDLYRLYTEYKVAKGYKNRASSAIFTEIANNNKWSGNESLSGPGSDISQTIVLIEEIPKLLHSLSVKNMLDIPCGDHNWMKNVDLSKVNYVGGDIVKKLVDQNNDIYGNHSKRFILADLTQSLLPKSDLLLVRDCLVHLSFEENNLLLANLKRSNIKYLLTTTFPQTRRNYNITTGNWRPLNLLKLPFNFPPPILLINENCSESYGQYTDKSLGLWEIKDLPDSLKK
jgi:hypothetical protein